MYRSAAIFFFHWCLVLRDNPEVTLDVTLTDEVVDILEERADVAIRAGPLRSSALITRKLGQTRKMIVGAPAYLERHTIPSWPSDLDRHNLIGPSYIRSQREWPFVGDEGPVSIRPRGTIQASDGEALRQLALAGAGLARLSAFQVRNDIGAGRLVPVLEEFNAGDVEEFHAVYIGHGQLLPTRIRAFLDFLVKAVKLRD